MGLGDDDSAGLAGLDPATLAVHAGAEPSALDGAAMPPLVLSTIYENSRAGEHNYGRERNATWERLETVLAALERGPRAAVFASGMATIAAVVDTVPVGGRVVAAHNSYSGTRQLLRRLHDAERAEVVLVDIADTEAVTGSCDGAALLCLESLTNPMLTMPDLRACIDAAHDAGAMVMVDNTFATSVTLTPLTWGADVVVHSLTKYVGGHSDLLLGGLVCADPALAERLVEHRTLGGAIPGQLETWLALRGIRTLDVRMRRQMASAATLAGRLVEHRAVARVHYPGLASHPQHTRAARQLEGGFGAVLSIEVAGGREAAEAVCAATRLWLHATSLGGVESTLERRRRYLAESDAVPESLLRLSVGIEAVEDLAADLVSALDGGASR